MTGIRSRARQALVIAAIIVLILLLGPAFVPQQLRADAASRLADFAQYIDNTLTDAWYSAFAAQGSDHRAGVSASPSGSGSHYAMSAKLTVGAAADDSESFIDVNDLGAYSAGDGSGSATDGVLKDMLQNGNLGGSGGLGAFARNSASGAGGNGSLHSGGTGASGGGALGSGSSGTPSRSARSRKSEGLTDVKPGAHQDRGAGMGSGFVSLYDVADASWDHVAPNNGRNGSGAGNVSDPANGDVVGLNGPPPQGDGGSTFQNGPVFQNEGNGGNGDLDPPNISHHDPQTEGHGPSTEPDSGPLSGVPEPGSLVLMSLGLGAVLLWGKFRSARQTRPSKNHQ